MLALDDPAFLSRFHSGFPVQRIGDSPFFAVGSWELIADVVRRPQEFSSNLTATMVATRTGRSRSSRWPASATRCTSWRPRTVYGTGSTGRWSCRH
ncbi:MULTISPECIES: hypothetical protein [Gordonia]|uniref:hypothetical protein n=1 Tax=Gordonia TaxID=2053 RepID=UPI001E31D598|nr:MULTISPECIES: hypothetical protein [Gordonia]UKO93861.1 hypothetical protein IHQ52_11540 [Gordonia amicalis]UOG21486.1 hypothetical protein MTX80_21710 [Gordonia amicalis]